ncbi:MAG: spore germination protein [Alicyclobacillus sp.]|nr:spore germination protein [Alicyclobacillus sp.]
MPPIRRELQQNVDYLNKLLGIGQGPGHSWDIMAKPFSYGGFQMMSYVLNGYFLTMNVVLLIENLQAEVKNFLDTHSDGNYTLQELISFLNTRIAFVQVQSVTKMSDVVRFILSGPMVTFIDGLDEALLIDTRIYPMRSIQESEVERVIRGPRDGFTETMLMNTALIRRRLRDPSLRAELMQVGTRSKTDVTLMYIEEVTNPAVVSDIRNRLQSIDVDGVIMAEQSVTDLIGRVKWNPYPLVRYTERPDVAATALVEGHVVIVVDTSPEVIIAPVTLFQLLQHPEEYHSYPLVGTAMRWVILFSALVSVLLPGLFLMMNIHPAHMPKWMAFFHAHPGTMPLWVELLIAEVLLNILRLAVMNAPTMIGSMVSIVAAVIFGQFASKIQLLEPEVLVYMALVMACQFALPSFELASANQLARWFIIVVTEIGRAVGYPFTAFVISIIVWVIFLSCTRSFGVPYFWPLIPFQWRNGMTEVLLRRPTSSIRGRPSVLHPRIRARKG